MPSVRFVHYKYLFHSSFDYRGIGSVLTTYPQSDLFANLRNDEVDVTCKDFICIYLMLIAPVVLLVANDGEVAILINPNRKDYHVTGLVIVVCRNDGTFTLKVPLIAIIHLVATKSECFGKCFLLTVLHLLHTVIDGEVFEFAMTDEVQLCTI